MKQMEKNHDDNISDFKMTAMKWKEKVKEQGQQIHSLQQDHEA